MKRSTVQDLVLLSPEDEDLKDLLHWYGIYAGLLYKGIRYYLHDFIMQRINLYDKTKVVDHVNQNHLDNRRENLRNLTFAQNCINNCRNIKPRYVKRDKIWRVRVRRDYKEINLGSFKTEQEANLVLNNFLKKEGIAKCD